MIIFDLDGTLANCEHRKHFIDPKKNLTINCDRTGCWDNGWKPDWKAFFDACHKDTPINPTIQILNNLILLDNHIEIWSGRCESVREKTEDWLYDLLFENKQYSIKIKMRPIGDYTPDDQLKEKWLDEAIANGIDIEYIFDDCPKVVRMWRRRGIFVFDCNQSNLEF